MVKRTSGDTGPGRRSRLNPAPMERPRLTRALHAVAPGGTALLVAPPGYGATTVMALAVAASGGPVAWVDLAGLGPESGWQALCTAVGEACGVDPPPEPGVAWVQETIAGADGLWLALDGLDCDDHGDLAVRVRTLASMLPPGVRLVVTSNDARIESLDWPLSITRIGAGALALLPDEAVGLLLSLAGDIDGMEIDRILGLADGWAAAVVAAGRHAALDSRVPASTWLPDEGSELLLGGWLDGLPPAVAQMLACTIVLDEISLPACALMCSDEVGVPGFTWLSDHAAYVERVPGEDADRSIRRHPLLTALVRRRIRGRDLGPAHLAAARWFADQGRISDAVEHLLAAGQAHDAAALVREHENASIEAGRSAEVDSWYSAIPSDALGGDVEHLLRRAWSAALIGDRAGAALAAERFGVRVESLADPGARGEDGLSLAGQRSLLLAYVALMAGDPDRAIPLARRAMDEFMGDPPRNAPQLAPMLLVRGLLWSGDSAAARRELDALAHQSFPTDVIRESILKGLRAQVLVLEGRIREAAVLTRAARHWHLTQNLDPLEAGILCAPLAEGMVTAESGDPVGAVAGLRRVVDTATARGMIGQAAFAMAALARAQGAAGDIGDGLRTLAEAKAALRDSTPGSSINAVLARSEAWLLVLSGDASRAERLVAILPSGEDRALLWCRLALATHPVAVERTITSIEPRNPRQSVETRLLLACLALRRSPKLAEVHLLKAADIADEHGLALALVGMPPPLVDIAETIGRRLSVAPLVGLAGSARPSMRSTVGVGREVAPLPAPLSPGETELMTLLPGRLTIAEIAEVLGVSVNTVKTRLQRLYRKLGVPGRNAAVEMARQRGLLL